MLAGLPKMKNFFFTIGGLSLCPSLQMSNACSPAAGLVSDQLGAAKPAPLCKSKDKRLRAVAVGYTMLTSASVAP